MNHLNQVIIEGNLCRNAEVITTPKGKRYCTMPMAINRYFKDKEGNDVNEVNYVDIQTWDELCCENAKDHGVKGRAIRVVGRLKQDRWTGKDGKNNSKLYVIAEHVEFKPFKQLPDNTKTEKEIQEDVAF